MKLVNISIAADTLADAFKNGNLKGEIPSFPLVTFCKLKNSVLTI